MDLKETTAAAEPQAEAQDAGAGDLEQEQQCEELQSSFKSPQSGSGDVESAWPVEIELPEEAGLAKLLVGNGADQVVLSCNKQTLAFHSPAIKEKFRRGQESDLPEWIVLGDEDPAAFQLILQYIQTGQWDLQPEEGEVDLEMALKVLDLTEKFEMVHVKSKTVKLLINLVADLRAAVKIYEGVKSISSCLDGLKDLAWSFIVQRFQTLVCSPAFLLLSKETVCSLLMSEDAVCISEENVFMAVWRWGSEHANHYAVGLADVLQDVIPLVRFPTMTPEAFRRVVLPTEVMQTEDIELLEYYWKLQEKDTVAAKVMALPFSKHRRTGKTYSVNVSSGRTRSCFGLRRGCAAIGLQTPVPVDVLGMSMKGNICQANNSRMLKVVTYIRASGNWRRRYSRIFCQTSRLSKHDSNTSELTFDPPIRLDASRKYVIRVFPPSSKMPSSSAVPTSWAQWKDSLVTCAPDSDVQVVVKSKIFRETTDLSFNAITFSLPHPFDRRKYPSYSTN